MQQKKYSIIANWKMYLSYQESISYLEKNAESLKKLSTKDFLIVCPSYESLATCKEILSTTPLLLGAQDCSEYDQGPYSGQVSALSLKETGCTYCIIGHSETFGTWEQSKEIIQKKLTLALKYSLKPIICFGENHYEYENHKVEQTIREQINLFCTTLKENGHDTALFAYEPRWAIGSGKTPSYVDIEKTVTLAKNIARSHAIEATMLYGGSVSSETIQDLKKIPLVDGFLLGKASADFQELKKVVSLLHE